MHRISLRGARRNNLKSVNLELGPHELVAVTGVSGSGKSSLALGTLYAEGQRRFVESFSPYARQFLERLDRPDMDHLDPIAAAVAVDRQSPVKSSRSSVATMADLEPYLSGLFACEAVPLCETCGAPAVRADARGVAKAILAGHAGKRAIITYALRIDSGEVFLDVRESLLRKGYGRVILGGETRDLGELPPSAVLDGEKGQLAVVVDRLKLDTDSRDRLEEALRTAWSLGSSAADVIIEGLPAPLRAAGGLSCPTCLTAMPEPLPGLFSYQSAVGACPACKGFGRTIGLDFAKVIPNEDKSIADGAIKAWMGKSSQMERRLLKKFCDKRGISMTRPWRELTPAEQHAVREGEGTWSGGKYPGVRAWFEWLETKTYKMHVRVLLSRYRAYDPCAACGGKRLSPSALSYRVGGLDLGAFHELEAAHLLDLLTGLEIKSAQGAVLARELIARVSYLVRVGLGHLTLDRQSRTLSGGEAQRVSLTAALGTELVGALFVLDEPTVGLHPSDVVPLTAAMRELADKGNAVVVIEHDRKVIEGCDRVVELGVAAGPQGGAIVFDGATSEIAARPDLATYRTLYRARDAAHGRPDGRAVSPKPARTSGARSSSERGSREALVLTGVTGHNLRDLSVSLPLGQVVAVTGVSGSGKSSLVDGVLYRALARRFGEGGDIEPPLAHRELRGVDLLRGVTLVDQSPLGRTSRGNAATYSGAWNRIRTLFAETSGAITRGFGPSHFSFNVEGGRCEACKGEGSETIEMQFLADVALTCALCGGSRFSPEVLEVRLRGLSVGDVLRLSVDEALAHFKEEPAIIRALGPLQKLGLGYLSLGQPLSTVSGGEAQRLKLARALGMPKKGRLFILDEPSAGLHDDEALAVVSALFSLTQGGASVVVVEHDLSIISAADWVIEMGPLGGREGGRIVFEGTPTELETSSTKTGEALRALRAPRVLTQKAPRAFRAPSISIESAREHNLKDLSLEIPHGGITVVTGPSGSGKSTLAFDVVFAEGQRRFLETLTPYARQFLPMLPRPNVDRVVGVPPAIALEQRTTRSGTTSTVATMTEIAHYLRLLFAKVGVTHCPTCDDPISSGSAEAVFASLSAEKKPILVSAPVVSGRKGTYLEVFDRAAQEGMTRAVVDGELRLLSPPPKLAKTKEHSIELVVFEGPPRGLTLKDVESALSLGRGLLHARKLPFDPESAPKLHSTSRRCVRCDNAVPEVDPRWFSFHTEQGKCPSCGGSGLRNPEAPPSKSNVCKACDGTRLAPLPRAQRLAGKRYPDVMNESLSEVAEWVSKLVFSGRALTIAKTPRVELERRLEFACDVGLGYLTLGRAASTLSGGEVQRLRLAAQLGSGLTGALYVLDEPTIGLHPSDTERLIRNLRRLADMGSTVLMVEHDADTIRAADRLIDLGPTGGRGGGKILAMGAPADVLQDPASPTGKALRDEIAIGRGRSALPSADAFISLSGASAHNLKIPLVKFPCGRLTVVVGVSGSGKSTLTGKILLPASRAALASVRTKGKKAADEGEAPLAHDALSLPRTIERVLAVDQAPIGRTSRSIPATYLGIFDTIRALFASSKEARVLGLTASHFSFNSTKGGRCTLCAGQGVISHEMAFLPDVKTVCSGCSGLRFDAATMRVRYLGRTIGEVLDLSAEEAALFFQAHPSISGPLSVMVDLGLGYLKLGQGSHTLSGGEAQRVKLAAELAPGTRHKNGLYVLDEPTTGLHLSDVARLIGVLGRLVDRGDTVVVVEHHPAVMASADWIVELGPGGGAAGGNVIAEGPPSAIAKKSTPTGHVLRPYFK